METFVYLGRSAQKDLKKIPKHILVLFDLWIEIIETSGTSEMRKIKGYRDHALKGDRKGQRSSSLSRSWRIIYTENRSTNEIIVEVLEVNHHEYKK